MVITQAVGSRIYGEMALSLCLAFMQHFPDMELAVLTDGAFQAAGGKRLTNVKTIPVTARNPFRNKTEINQSILSGAYFDADTMIVSKSNAKAAFESLDSARLYLHKIDPAKAGHLQWDSMQNLKSHYQLKNELPVFNSSIIAWKSNTKKFWNEARKAYQNQCPSAELIGGYYPDELAFGAAASKTGISISDERFVCFPWSGTHWNQFGFMSFAGNNASDEFMRAYNRLSNKARKHFGFPQVTIDRRKKLSYGK
jgi:hypothetical protein